MFPVEMMRILFLKRHLNRQIGLLYKVKMYGRDNALVADIQLTNRNAYPVLFIFREPGSICDLSVVVAMESQEQILSGCGFTAAARKYAQSTGQLCIVSDRYAPIVKPLANIAFNPHQRLTYRANCLAEMLQQSGVLDYFVNYTYPDEFKDELNQVLGIRTKTPARKV